MNMKPKNWLMLAGGIFVVLTLIGLMMRPSSVSVDTAMVQRGTLSIGVEEQGRTRARQRYTVAAPISGQLLRPDVQVGQQVQVGDVLVRIAPPPEDPRTEAVARAELAAAEARQRETEALLEESRGNYQRTLSEARRRSELYGKGLISIEERNQYAQNADAAKARLSSTEASLAAARAQVQSARSQLLGMNDVDEGMVDVQAPVSGQVLQVFEESARVIQAGSPLFELSAGNTLELVIDVLTQDAVTIHPGDPIEIVGWGVNNTLHGKVRTIEPRAFTKVSTLGVEEQRVNVIGDLAEPSDSLGAEYRIDATIITWSEDDVLLIPTSAIFRRVGAWHTFVVDSGVALLQQLKLGKRGTEFAEVLEGVQEEAQVILFPSDLIEAGVRVEAAERVK